METDKLERIIVHFIQGGISEEEMRQLNAWLAQSDENKQLFFDIKNIYELRQGGSYPGEEEMAQSLARLNRKINLSTPAGKLRRTRENRIPTFYKYAAVAAACVLLTLGVQTLFRSASAPAAYTAVDMGAGARMSRFSLSDGTTVILNASTKFRFPERFDGDLREVYLDGEAFFEVAHNEKKPFVVHTDKQEIRVLGTSFNVMDYSADDYTITTLVSGSVAVRPLSATGEKGKEYTLKPNQQAFYNTTAPYITVSDVEIDPDRSWVNKIYHFRDETLSVITQRLEKLYGVNIDIADETLKNERYTGTFRTDMNIDENLKLINFKGQFSYIINNGKITIYSNLK